MGWMTDAEEQRTVWILGSGFSRPLGGPLLNDFFSEGLLENVVRAFGLDDLRTIERAHQIFNAPSSAPWQDAEHFLELIDYASLSVDDGDVLSIANHARAVLGDRVDDATVPGFIGLGRAVRRYLAGACHHFVPTRRTNLRAVEKWRPYLRWAELLSPNDTVITFNYDLVVERAAGDRVEVLRPGGDCVIPSNKPALLKLHGSVDWYRTAYDDEILAGVEPRELIQNGYEIVIAGPGPAKLRASEKTFKMLWQRAVDVLREATCVVFIGYRFPETDAFSRAELLGALTKNPEEGLTVRIVLGPDTGSHDVQRLESMLQWSLAHRPLVRRDRLESLAPSARKDARKRGTALLEVEPLWSQDFLSVFRTERLGWAR